MGVEMTISSSVLAMSFKILVCSVSGEPCEAMRPSARRLVGA